MNQELSTTVGRLIETYFPQLRRTVRKNLTRLTGAFLQLALSVRFGYGGLHLTSVARVLPQGVNFKSSYKWLSRFLKCKYFRSEEHTSELQSHSDLVCRLLLEKKKKNIH